MLPESARDPAHTPAIGRSRAPAHTSQAGMSIRNGFSTVAVPAFVDSLCSSQPDPQPASRLREVAKF
jgi:hypothetical protein